MLVLAARALHDAAFRRIVKGHVLVQRHARLHGRIDPCADAARLALPESEHDPIGRKQARIIKGLSLRRIARRQFRIAADVKQSAHRVADQIGGFVPSVGTVLAEAGDGNQN